MRPDLTLRGAKDAQNRRVGGVHGAKNERRAQGVWNESRQAGFLIQSNLNSGGGVRLPVRFSQPTGQTAEEYNG